MYDQGHTYALRQLGLIKEATPAPLRVSQNKNPFIDVHKKLERAFQIKTPKFDTSAMMKRLLNNPLKQPRVQLYGTPPPMKI